MLRRVPSTEQPSSHGRTAAPIASEAAHPTPRPLSLARMARVAVSATALSMLIEELRSHAGNDVQQLKALREALVGSGDGDSCAQELIEYLLLSSSRGAVPPLQEQQQPADSTKGTEMEAEEGTAPPPLVRTDCTGTDFSDPADTMKEERWPEDSPEYLAGNERHNRYKPPPPEVEGDVFDRQRCIVGFDQGVIEAQVCLVLGTGGIGQDAALALARLGVHKIILVDCDDYEATNLTRQVL
jgi:hypothetical protein